MNYDQYYQKGGNYMIPTEVFNELIEENKHLKDLQKSMDKQYRKLENNWNGLKKYAEEEIKHLEKSRYVSFNEYGENKLRIFKDLLFKIQKLEEGGNDAKIN